MAKVTLTVPVTPLASVALKTTTALDVAEGVPVTVPSLLSVKPAGREGLPGASE
jgi:hypothetical protein